jgi:CDP-diacylglycerol---glycerol-3-phosphate 3-phosphatidyltransferase
MKMANILTIARILLSPVFILFFIQKSLLGYSVCLLVAIAIEITDFLDGKIARKYQQISDFGKLMDPFADSIARFSIFLSFMSIKLAPVWMVAIFFYRDVLVSVIRVFSMKEGVVISARRSGKTKAWVQAVCIFTVLFWLLGDKLQILPIPLIYFSGILLPTWVIGIAALVTLWSGLDYWIANKGMVYIAMHYKEKTEKPEEELIGRVSNPLRSQQ